MSCPTEENWMCLKRFARYIRDHPRSIMRYDYQRQPRTLTTYSDSDFAGCLATRKSTSGGVIMHGDHLLKGWSTTQSRIALSSEEAEYYVVVMSASQSLGARSMLRDMGFDLPIEIHTDSSAALGIASRTGLGKVRHLDVNLLWVQRMIKQGAFKLLKIDGKDNIADMFSKNWEPASARKFLPRMSVEFREGRSGIAPGLRSIGISRVVGKSGGIGLIEITRILSTSATSAPSGGRGRGVASPDKPPRHRQMQHGTAGEWIRCGDDVRWADADDDDECWWDERLEDAVIEVCAGRCGESDGKLISRVDVGCNPVRDGAVIEVCAGRCSERDGKLISRVDVGCHPVQDSADIRFCGTGQWTGWKVDQSSWCRLSPSAGWCGDTGGSRAWIKVLTIWNEGHPTNSDEIQSRNLHSVQGVRRGDGDRWTDLPGAQ